MSTRRKTSAIAGSLLLASCLVACQSPTAPEGDLLRIQATPPTLSIQNIAKDPVYTFIAERGSLALIDWVPCTVPTQCAGLAPGNSRIIPYSEITGYTTESREAVVFHWRLVPTGGGAFAVDSIRSVVVTLRIQ